MGLNIRQGLFGVFVDWDADEAREHAKKELG